VKSKLLLFFLILSFENKKIMKITVIGESNIDIAVKPHAEANAKGCVPGNIAFHHGGVARNIAHNLCLLNHEVKLVSVFGNDDFASRMISDCKQIGMDLSLSSHFKDAKSPVFLSFNDDNGNMISSVSDASINDRMDLDWLKDKMDAISQSDLVVADTLLSAESMAYLIDRCEVPLYVDTVSPVKAMRFVEAMRRSNKHSVFALKCNMAEAVQITNKNDVFEIINTLNSIGINHVYLTLGSSGAIHCSDGIVTSYPALASHVVNVTGSGDAFFAGVIHAHSIGRLGKDAVPFGLKVSQHNIKNEAPVNPTLRVSIFND
jgi:pseudouridine kinase